MAQLGWLEWRLTDEELPDLFDMVDSAYPGMPVVERWDTEAIADPQIFAQELAQDIAVTLTGEFAAVSKGTATQTRALDTSAFMRAVPRPRDSRPLVDSVEGERTDVTDSGEFSNVPHTGISARTVPESTPDSVPGFALDPDIAAMFQRRQAADNSDDDVTVEVDLSDLQREKRNRP